MYVPEVTGVPIAGHDADTAGRASENLNLRLRRPHGKLSVNVRQEHELQNVSFRYWATSLNVAHSCPQFPPLMRKYGARGWESGKVCLIVMKEQLNIEIKALYKIMRQTKNDK